MGASIPDFAKKLNIVRAEGFPSGDDQIKWLGCSQGEGILVVHSALNTPALADQNTGQQFIDLATGSHDERSLLRSGSICAATGGCHR